MAIADDLCDLSRTLATLRQQVIKISPFVGETNKPQEQPRRLKLTAMEGSVTNTTSPGGRVYLPGPAKDSDADSFLACWCLYEQHRAMGTTLGAGADLMFTEGMNGCAFAIGSNAGAGVRKVWHINATDSDGRFSGNTMQKFEEQQANQRKIAGTLTPGLLQGVIGYADYGGSVTEEA
jgi:hypothetical protein